MTTRRGFIGLLAGIIGGVVFAKPLVRPAGETGKPASTSQEIPRAYGMTRDRCIHFKTTLVDDGKFYENTWFTNHTAITGANWYVEDRLK